MRRRWLRGLVAGFLMMALMVPVAVAAPTATAGGYTFELISAIFDGTNTTYTYQVTGPDFGGGSSGSTVKDLSHWTLALCSDLTFVTATPGIVWNGIGVQDPDLDYIEVGLDPTTGLTGVKWDFQLDKDAQGTYTVTVAGNPTTGEVQFVNKAGQGNHFGYIDGPTCGTTITTNATFTVLKWYDTNGNGVIDLGESLIDGWKMTLTDDTTASTSGYTGANGPGTVNFTVSSDRIYDVTELDNGNMPGTGVTGYNWVATTPTTAGSFSGAANQTIEFGNRCVYTSNAGTIGFWSNKNGQAQITATVWTNLRAAYTTQYDWYNFGPATSKSKLVTYLRNASASDMYYMLSAQMIATWLNVETGKVPGTLLVDTPDGWMSVADALVAAGAHLSATADRDDQEAWKDLFDSINNNAETLVAPAGTCGVVYTP